MVTYTSGYDSMVIALLARHAPYRHDLACQRQQAVNVVMSLRASRPLPLNVSPLFATQVRTVLPIRVYSAVFIICTHDGISIATA